jgi:hypothetical protein
MTVTDIRPRQLAHALTERAQPAVLESHQPVCAGSVRPVQRIAVVTTGPASREMVSAVRRMAGDNLIIRFIERQGQPSTTAVQAPAGSSSLTPWSNWADVVITDAHDDSIAESVLFGYLPVVAIPKHRLGSHAARHALKVAHRWSCRGLALQLDLEKPIATLLQSAAGMRTKPRECTTNGAVWISA